MSRIAPGPASIAPLYHALTRKLIPWAQQWETSRIAIARASFTEVHTETLPLGVTAAPRKINTSLEDLTPDRFLKNQKAVEVFPNDHMEVAHYAVIICTLSGSAEVEAGDYYFRADEGNFIFFPPRVPRPDGSRPHLRENDSGATDVLWLSQWQNSITLHICHSCGQRHYGSGSPEECIVLSQQALLCFEVLIEELTKPDGGDPLIYRGLLLTLLAVIRREMETGNFVQSGVAVLDAPPPTAEDPIQRVAQYAQFHLNEPLTIDGMARRAYMSRSNFTRRFREVMGVSFLEFLTEQRLTKVKVLLRDTDWSVETICVLSGLKLSNLRILLRARTGYSPLEYRKHARKSATSESKAVVTAGSSSGDPTEP